VRKSIILTITGTFIIITGLLCNIGKPSIYEKKVSFSSPDEVINKLNISNLAVLEDPTINNWNIIYSDDFNECLSKRKRLTNPGGMWNELDVEFDTNKDLKIEKERVINDYITKCKKLKDFKVEEKLEAYSLVGTCMGIEGYGSLVAIDVVLIDEGNGWVIDYFMDNSYTIYGEQHDKSQQ